MHRWFSALVLLLLIVHSTTSTAQDKAFGVRGGLANISNGEGNHAIFEAFFDVPMGSIMFSPELDILLANSEEPAYGLSMMFRRPVYDGNWRVFADIGGQFIVWDTITTAGGPPKRAHVGVPIRLAVERLVGRSTEIEAMLTYTPMFFLGADPYYRSLFGVLAGIRILVP